MGEFQIHVLPEPIVSRIMASQGIIWQNEFLEILNIHASLNKAIVISANALPPAGCQAVKSELMLAYSWLDPCEQAS